MSNVIIPSVQKGRGGGHLSRSLKLLEVLPNWEILILYQEDSLNYKKNLHNLNRNLNSRIHFDWNELSQPIDAILLDQFQCSEELFYECRKRTDCLMSLDEGGAFRNQMDYLLDSLPNLNSYPPNISSRNFLFFDPPQLTRANKNALLISFGNEDPKHLSSYMVRFLLDKMNIPPQEIHVVKGPMFSGQDFPSNITILDAPDSLDKELLNYSCLLTSFGITAFEGLRSGLKVLLLNPSRYHEKLSRNTNIPSLGIKTVKKQKEKLIIDLLRNRNLSSSPWDIKGPSLVEWINSIKGVQHHCVCCGQDNPVIYRREKGNFYYCRKCHNYYYVFLKKEKKEYNESYFFEDYENQYGKTYLDDFEHIYNMGLSRLKIVNKIQPIKENQVLLDLGCAYGPFLKAAKDMGYRCLGVEVSSHAAQWVNENLKVEVENCSIFDTELDKRLSLNTVDVLSLWYVIEHFHEQQELWTRFYRWITPKGILAFSTPNGAGISAKKKIKTFLHHSPEDHFVIYTPKGIKQILKRYGFSLKKVRITGHHPERISRRAQSNRLVYNLLLSFSKLFRLGDTFEIYAERKAE